MNNMTNEIKDDKEEKMTTMLIHNDDQYKKYIKEIHELMGHDPDIDTLEGERLSLLAFAVKEYETKHFFFSKPTPIEAIRFRMEEQNLIQNDLVSYIGSKSKVSEILAGKRNLTITMIRALNTHLGIPLDILIQDSKKESYKLNLKNIDWKKFPIDEMVNRNWIKFKSSIVSESSKNVLAEFFKPLGGLSPQNTMWRRSIHNRYENNSNLYELIAWIAKVMMLADKINVGDYDKNLITMDYLRELAKLSKFNQGPLLAKEMLAKNGIKLIFLKQLSKTKVDGACFLDTKGQPVIGMSLRHDRVDNFWYTLLHEMSHIYKHLNDQNQFIDNLDVKSSNAPEEKEADKIARESFIPRSIWKRSEAFSLRTNSAIQTLAKQLNIHPAIIAGRIRYETNDYTKFSDLIGQDKVTILLRGHINE
jgi:HTH-type transcriptional regulator / antitoxin HigA